MCCSLIFDNLHHSDLVSAVNLVLLQFYIQREKKFTMGIMANKQTNSRSFKTPLEYTVDTQSISRKVVTDISYRELKMQAL